METIATECPKCRGNSCANCTSGVIRVPVEAPANDVARLRVNRDFPALLAFDAAERANGTIRKANYHSRRKAKGTHRRSISIRWDTYQRFKAWAEAQGKTCSGALEEMIAEKTCAQEGAD